VFGLGLLFGRNIRPGVQDGENRRTPHATSVRGQPALLASLGKTSPSATANLSFTYDAGCETMIRAQLTAGNDVRLFIAVSITHAAGTSGPFALEDYALQISPETDEIVVKENPEGEVGVPISTTARGEFENELPQTGRAEWSITSIQFRSHAQIKSVSDGSPWSTKN